MRFEVKLFAVARQLAGQPIIEVDASAALAGEQPGASTAAPSPSEPLGEAARAAVGPASDSPLGLTIGQLRAALRTQYPQLAPTLERVVFAVNSAYAGEQTVIFPTDEIACIPPVSGG